MKNKTIDHLDLARRIRAAGCPIYIAEDDGDGRRIPCDGLRVRQTGGVIESRAIDCSSGTAFVIYLTITVKLPNFAISAFGLKPPWKNEHLHWLEDPLVIDGNSQLYRFGAPNLPEFERGQVINHYADVRRILSAGQSIKGFLLGFGFDPMPERFKQGMTIPAFVSVYDQFGGEYQSPVELQADRNRIKPRVLRKGGLLDHPDAIVQSVAWGPRALRAPDSVPGYLRRANKASD